MQGGGKGPTQKQKDDAYYSQKRWEIAKKAHDEAVSTGASDVAEKKAAMDKAAKESKDAKAALDAAKESKKSS